MSDPVTNVEIEDVLSSIRRLVSEEGREKPRKTRPVRENGENRLVLTPALRVADRIGDAEAESQDVAEAPFELGPEFSEPARSDEIEFRHTVLEPLDDTPGELAGDEDEAEEDGADENAAPLILQDATLPEPALDDTPPPQSEIADPPWSDPEATLHEAAALAEDVSEDAGALAADIDEPAQPDLSEIVSVEGDAEPESPPKGERMRRAAMLSAKIQALEAAIAETPDQWEPDGVSDDDYAGTEVETLAWQSDSNDAQAEEPLLDALDDVKDTPILPEDDADFTDDSDAAEDSESEEPLAQAEWPEAEELEAVDVEAEMPETEAGIDEAPQDDTLELHSRMRIVEEPEDNVPEAEPIEAELVLDPEDIGARDTPEIPASDLGMPDDLTFEEAVIDENTLREMVSDIVRQELQGALGERITRNVRKLVRREIHRALTTQDLD